MTFYCTRNHLNLCIPYYSWYTVRNVVASTGMNNHNPRKQAHLICLGKDEDCEAMSNAFNYCAGIQMRIKNYPWSQK